MKFRLNFLILTIILVVFVDIFQKNQEINASTSDEDENSELNHNYYHYFQ
jgi:hypothetical protein